MTREALLKDLMETDLKTIFERELDTYLIVGPQRKILQARIQMDSFRGAATERMD